MEKKLMVLCLAGLLILMAPVAHAVDLIADGRDTATVVGSVTAAHVGSNLEITYLVDVDYYCLAEIHAAAGINLNYIPRNKKLNPKIGKFYISQELGGCTKGIMVSIPGSDLGNPESGDDILIAAHALVTNDGGEFFEESAWGDGFEFGHNNWCTYFTIVW